MAIERIGAAILDDNAGELFDAAPTPPPGEPEGCFQQTHEALMLVACPVICYRFLSCNFATGSKLGPRAFSIRGGRECIRITMESGISRCA